MEFKRELWTRIGLIFLALIFIGIGIYNFYLDITPVFDKITQNDFQNINFSFSDSFLAFFIIGLGIVIYFIGRHWKDSLKSLTNVLIMLAVFCVTMGIILFGINTSSNDLTSSIQPSIDFMVANVIDDTIANNLEVRTGEKMNLILSENVKTDKIYVMNMTAKQAKNISNELKLYDLTEEEELILGKVVISMVFEELKKTPEFANTPVPLSMISSEINKAGLDLSLLDLLDITVFASLFNINNDASVNILISSNSEKKEIIIGKLKSKDVQLIWNNLGIDSTISEESKIKITEILLSVMLSELEKNNLASLDIPIASLKEQIPEEYKQILNYDLLNSNVTIKQGEISRARDDCTSNKLNLEEVCNIIEMTSYDTFMSNIDNLTSQADINIPINLTSTLENVNTINNLENTIENKTNSYNTWFLFAIVFFILSSITYYGHFKLFKRELIPLHIPYYLSKINLYNFIPTFVFLGIFIYLITSGMLLEFISTIIPVNGDFNIITIVSQLPIYISMITLLGYVLVLNGWYLLFSLVIYISLFIWLKIEVKKSENFKEVPKFE